MEADLGYVLADLACGFEVDDLAVDFVTELQESLGDLSGTYAAIDVAVSGSLGGDDGANAFKSCGCVLSLGQNGCDLVGLLTLVLGQHFQRCVRCDNCQTLGNQVVAAVAVLYLYDIILITSARDVLLQNYFHLYGAFNGYTMIISSGRLRREAERGGVHASRPEPHDAGTSARFR